MGGYERCKKLWCMREHCRFLTVMNLSSVKECVVEQCGMFILVYSDFIYSSRMCI